MSRRSLALALVAIMLCGGCGKEELPTLPLGTSVNFPVSVLNAADGAIERSGSIRESRRDVFGRSYAQ